MRKMLNSGMKSLVMEVSSQALKLNRVLGIKFDITLFSNLSPDHIGPGEHENFDDYFACKKKLFDKYESNVTIANADDEYTQKILADCKNPKIYYSIDAPSNVKAEKVALCRNNKILGMSFDCNIKNRTIPCSLSIPGEFNIHNALATLSVANALGIDMDFAADTLSKMNIDGRFETLVSPNGACFVIDYAHNGLSLKSALCALRKYEPRRLICLFGSVGCRTQVRRAQMGAVAAEYADFSILTSDNPNTENPQAIIDEIAIQYEDPDSYISIADRKEAIKYAFEIAEQGDIVLLAGKGHERYQLINGKNEYFCEREILENCMNEIKLSKT
jgi:UDP-N-acetylmuramoyl-L-alanyl-D-glutamate--2,6-diaminopimelate ligase